MDDELKKSIDEIKTGIQKKDTRIDQVENKLKYLETLIETKQQPAVVETPDLAKFIMDTWKYKILGKSLRAGYVPEYAKKASSGQNEGTGADGGYAVPTEYYNQIIGTLGNYGFVRKNATTIKMGSNSMRVPTLSSGVTVSWESEGTASAYTKAALSYATLTARKLKALVPITEELMDDNNVNIEQWLVDVVGWRISEEEDRVGLVGSTGDGDAFNGILNTATVVVTMDSGDTTFAKINADYLSDMIAGLDMKYLPGAQFILSPYVLGLIRKLKDDNSNYIWMPPGLNTPGTVWGYPYTVHDQMPGSSSSGAATKFLIFGNPKHVLFGDRQDYTISRDYSVLFTSDEIVLKFKERIAIAIGEASAFAVLETATS